MSRKTILLVEDNERLNEINRRALEADGCEVLTASTLAQARAHLKARRVELILLDVMLPDGDGIAFCGEIRRQTDAHILFLTSKLAHNDKIRGLETGGDDYITKPYKLGELLSRVRAALRRRAMSASSSPAHTITREPLVLDTLSGQAFLNGVDMQLSQKEFAVLRVLVENEGKNLSKESVYQTVWGQPMNDDDTAVKTAVSRLRKKLEGGGFGITALRGEGYRFE